MHQQVVDRTMYQQVVDRTMYQQAVDRKLERHCINAMRGYEISHVSEKMTGGLNR